MPPSLHTCQPASKGISLIMNNSSSLLRRWALEEFGPLVIFTRRDFATVYQVLPY